MTSNVTDRTPEERVEFLRQASYVDRFHCSRLIGGYTSHEHTNNMTNMLLVLHPEPTVRLVKMLQWHDAGEFLSGDIPSPGKRFFGLGEVNNQVEQMVREEFGLEVLDPTEEEVRWLKSLDLVELYLFIQDQVHMGNGFMEPTLLELTNYLDAKCIGFPGPVRNYYMFVSQQGRPVMTTSLLAEQLEEKGLG
jgi:hypothetical protein